MKKLISITMALIGAVTMLWASYTIFHYGAVNMRRVEAQAYAWKLEHYGP